MAYIGNKADTAFTSLIKQDLTGASGISLTLSHAVANANDIALYINNVRQEPTTAYTASGTAVSLTGSVASSDDIYLIYLARAVQTTVTPDASVTTAKLADNAVTTAKIASNAVNLTSKVTGVLPNANIIGQATRPSFYAANLNGTTWNGGTLTGADASGYGYANGMSYNASSGELTIPLAGLYFISFGILQNPNSGRGEANVQRQPSGGSYGAIFTVDGNGTTTFNTIGSGFTFNLAVNDKLKVLKGSGTAYAYAHPSHYFNVAYIGG